MGDKKRKGRRPVIKDLVHYIQSLVLWSAEKQSRRACFETRGDKVHKIWVYDESLRTGDYVYIHNLDEAPKPVEDIDLEGRKVEEEREQLRKLSEKYEVNAS